MTAGAGICHSEVSTQSTTVLHGVQLWTVLPDSARHGQRRFDHCAPEFVELDGARALVFMGTLFGETSPIPTFTPLVGAEIRLQPGATVHIDVDPTFEHGLLVDEGPVELEGVTVNRRELAYTGVDETQLRLHNPGDASTRVIFIGGEPFAEDIVMWWNFIGRTHDEVAQYRREWEEHSVRFGETHGYISHDPDGLVRLPAPTFPNSRLRPRVNPEPVARPEMRIES